MVLLVALSGSNYSFYTSVKKLKFKYSTYVLRNFAIIYAIVFSYANVFVHCSLQGNAEDTSGAGSLGISSMPGNASLLG